MKNILILFLLCTAYISGLTQNPEFSFDCKVIGSPPNNSNSSSNSTCQISFNDYINAPSITLNVNFHVVPNRFANNAEAILAVRRLLDNINLILQNLDRYRIDQNISPAAFVPSTKVKCKLYSEPTNLNDINGGIWLYGNGVDWTDQYNGRALNIILQSELDALGNDSGGLSGDVAFTGTSGNTINVRNFFFHRNGDIGFFPVTLVHEIGHRLGLNHPEWCNNECANIDIDPALECSTNCPQVGVCSPNSFENNGGRRACEVNGNLVNLCRSSCDRTNLLTAACFRYPRAMTPCQWEVIFNDVRRNNPQYALLCFTASTFLLPQSPLNDYRASQSITSTSIIQGNRQVDYWAPTITLNAGFQVAQGTGFVAAPTTFPCCTAGSGGGEPNADNSNNPILEKQNEALTVIPNPFSESINISYEVTEDFDNSEMNIIDLSGRVVKNIPIKSQNKGRYQIELKTSDLSNGIYLIRYKSKNQVITKKIVKTSSN
jgi:Secretion system C-terminal sorting domain